MAESALKAQDGMVAESAGEPGQASAPGARLSRPSIMIVLVPFSIVLITFLFWYSTWFGRRPNDAEMAEYLTDTSVPHKTQHALSALADEMERGDPSARQWYPDVVKLAGNSEPGIREMAAWVMGEDNHNPEFHEVLKRLLGDSAVIVRWNAALGLVRFGDAAGEPELREMLRPFDLAAPAAGRIALRARPGDGLSPSDLVARISTGAGTIDVRSPIAGELDSFGPADGATVEAGQPLARIAPGTEQVWESLRALYLVGGPADLADLERYSQGVAGMPERVRTQARLTEGAIRGRSGSGAGNSASASGGQGAGAP
jgi:HEAT repeats